MLKILSEIYFFVISVRNYLYDKKILKSKKIDGLKIICIGNITVGGTGKTPAVQYYAKRFIEEEKKIAVVSRGYKGKRKSDPMIVCDGQRILCSPKESGDEPYLHAKTLNIPVIVSRKRYKGCLIAKEKFGAEIVIMDDGFQHRQLDRDWNVVLIDATNPFGNMYGLPMGILREPINELRRADEFVITKSDMVTGEKRRRLHDYLGGYKKKISFGVHKPSYFYDKEGNRYETTIIEGAKIAAVSGIANPSSFVKNICKFCPESIVEKFYPDHYDFSQKDADDIKQFADENGCRYILITEKDFVKLAKYNMENYLVMKLDFYLLGENNA